MKLLDSLFVNLCIVGMLLVTFNILTRKRKGFISPNTNIYRKLQFGAMMGSIGIVLMCHTIHFKGTILDLRQIPVVVAASYGGGMPPIVASMIIAVGRMILFGINKASLIASTLIIIIGFSCGAISKLRIHLTMRWLIMNVSNLILTSIVFFLLIDDMTTLLNIYLGFWLITLIGGFIIHNLTEYLRESRELFETAQKNAATDFLTGLNNVRKFDEVLKFTISKAHKYQEKVSFILIDVDHFKQINDTFGHHSGDEILKQVSEAIRDCCGSIDIVSRNGGEEFSVILPSCSGSQAIKVAERIRSEVERRKFKLTNGLKIKVTISLGVSTYGETTLNQQHLIKQADDCLYQAKRTGRNKVVQAS